MDPSEMQRGEGPNAEPAKKPKRSRSRYFTNKGRDLALLILVIVLAAPVIYGVLLAGQTYFMRRQNLIDHWLLVVIGAIVSAIAAERLVTAVFKDRPLAEAGIASHARWPTKRGRRVMVGTVLLVCGAYGSALFKEHIDHTRAEKRRVDWAQAQAEEYLRENPEPIFSRLGAFKNMTGWGYDHGFWNIGGPDYIYARRSGVFEKGTVIIFLKISPGGSFKCDFDGGQITFTLGG